MTKGPNIKLSVKDTERKTAAAASRSHDLK